jgi:hypothetical protein
MQGSNVALLGALRNVTAEHEDQAAQKSAAMLADIQLAASEKVAAAEQAAAAKVSDIRRRLEAAQQETGVWKDRAYNLDDENIAIDKKLKAAGRRLKKAQEVSVAKARLQEQKHNEAEQGWKDLHNLLADVPVVPMCRLPPVENMKVLGRGSYGEVFKAAVRDFDQQAFLPSTFHGHTHVAIKMAQVSATTPRKYCV